MVKVSNIFIGLKKTCLGVLKRGESGNDNETGLKEGGGIKILTTVLHSRAAPSLCEYSPPSAANYVYIDTPYSNFSRLDENAWSWLVYPRCHWHFVGVTIFRWFFF